MYRFPVAGILSAILVSASPALAADEPENPSNVATVRIYRYKQYVGSALEPSIYCDETELARMDNGRYFSVRVAPGVHTFRANDKQSGIQLEAKPGAVYYIRVELATGFWKGHGRLVLIQKEQGAFEVAKLKALDEDKIRDRERVAVPGADR